jgi:D-amino-acid oxidase
MDRSDLDALVIGAGVSGLTTAVQLAEAGLRVRVWTADPPEATTSMAAGAMWGPYLVEPLDKVRLWSRHTLRELRRLAAAADTGVRLVPGIEASRTPVTPPEWGDQLDGFRMCGPSDLPDGFATGWRFIAPLVDMPTYLAYLKRRLTAAGGIIEIRRVNDLGEATEMAPVVANCTGIGARHLVPDPELTAIRGQLVVVENPGITEFFTEDTGLSPDLLHIYPHGDTVVVGGLAVSGDYDLQADPGVATAIVTRCAAVDPRLRGVRVLDHRVGLRPTRPQVRVEAQRVNGTLLIHNYGHGGAGVTLSWGCATEVAELAHATR